MAFAKLLGPENDQVLLLIDETDDNRVAVKLIGEPPELGVRVQASIIIGSSDHQEAWDAAEQILAAATEDSARAALEKPIAFARENLERAH